MIKHSFIYKNSQQTATISNVLVILVTVITQHGLSGSFMINLLNFFSFLISLSPKWCTYDENILFSTNTIFTSIGKKIQDLLPVSLASILWQNNYFGIVSFLCIGLC